MRSFWKNFDPQGGLFGGHRSILGVLRVKKVKNVGSQIFIKISPEKYFDARTSMMRSVWQNFEAQGSIWGQRTILWVKTSKI